MQKPTFGKNLTTTEAWHHLGDPDHKVQEADPDLAVVSFEGCALSGTGENRDETDDVEVVGVLGSRYQVFWDSFRFPRRGWASQQSCCEGVL